MKNKCKHQNSMNLLVKKKKVYLHIHVYLCISTIHTDTTQDKEIKITAKLVKRNKG